MKTADAMLYRDKLAGKLKAIDSTSLEKNLKQELKDVLLQKYQATKTYKNARNAKLKAFHEQSNEKQNKKIIERFEETERGKFNKLHPKMEDQKKFFTETFKALSAQDRFMPFIKLRALIIDSQFVDKFIYLIQDIVDAIDERMKSFNKQFNEIFKSLLPGDILKLTNNPEDKKKFETIIHNMDAALDGEQLKDIKEFERLYVSPSMQRSGINVPEGLYKKILYKKMELGYLKPLLGGENKPQVKRNTRTGS